MEKRSLLQEFNIPYAQPSYFVVVSSRRLIPVTIPTAVMAVLLPLVGFLLYTQPGKAQYEMAGTKPTTGMEEKGPNKTVITTTDSPKPDPGSKTTTDIAAVTATSSPSNRTAASHKFVANTTTSSTTNTKKSSNTPPKTSEDTNKNRGKPKSLVGGTVKKVDKLVGAIISGK